MFSIRRITVGDITPVYKVRNHPDVIQNCSNKSYITIEEHIDYFNKFFDNNKNIWYVMCCNQAVVGYCRLEYDHNEYNISIAVLPEYRRFGIATTALKLVRRKVKEPVVSYILKDNMPSRKLFESCGYVEDNYEDKYLVRMVWRKLESE